MGSVCQKTENVINWPWGQEQTRSKGAKSTFAIIPEEESGIYSPYERSMITASQFQQNEWQDNVPLGNVITSGQSVYLFNVHLMKYLASHSIKTQIHHLASYEVFLQQGNHEQLCYNEWAILADNDNISSGDNIKVCIGLYHQLIHKLSQRYLLAIMIQDECRVYCGSNAEACWVIQFDTQQLQDGAFVGFKHREFNMHLQFLNQKASLTRTSQVILGDDEGRNNQWKIQLI